MWMLEEGFPKREKRVSKLKAALDVADEILSAAPIPGVAYAMPVLKSVAEQISLMRANVKTKEDVISRIQALRDLLVAIAEDVTAEVGALSLVERNQAEGEVQQSPVVKWRIKAFIERLEFIRNSAEARQRIRWYQRFWFAEPDAKFLKDLGRDIDNAKNNFELEGSIEIRKHVVELVMSTHEICRQMKEKDEVHSNAGNSRWAQPANASYTSALFEEKSRLQEGTRTAIRADLAKWAVDGDPGKRIYVLYGQAGMGKSSIAHTFCKQLQEQHFVSSFFFLRGHDACSDAYRVFPTLAYQLADSVSDLRTHIVGVARKHRAGHEQQLDRQFRTLILDPLKALATSPAPPSVIFVLDGVDECANASDSVPTVLRLLREGTREIPFLRILIATRPETYILDELRPSEDSDTIHWRDLQKEADIDDDIRLFIEMEFEKCKTAGQSDLLDRHPDATEQLTRLSSGLFIYASTVFKYITQKKHFAIERYEALLESDDRLDPGQAYQKLDMLYGEILKYAFGDTLGHPKQMAYARQMLCWLVVFEPVPVMQRLNAAELEIVGVPTSTTLDVLDGLRSVLILDGGVQQTTEIRACHASFPQFLCDSARCTDPAFVVDPLSGHAMIATSLFDLLARDDVDSLRDANGHIPEMWEYAKWYWDNHVRNARYTPELGRALRGFVEMHLENWLRKKHPWDFGWDVVALVDVCAEVHTWYKKNGPDDGLAAALDTIIDRRVKEIVAEAAQSPDEFLHFQLKRINVWAKKGYTPDDED
ncbi:hypothetical protein CERSUDRAFT_127686 [Gelatoporia subvermispora B]|uniref:NACHT domain-containing protein n=1 Tax=Ceriporiopsis subvermispora (strain B) TaxID=914234 RepID=M2QYI6_CERS8|nr:hypothetical protein CERSUDRAFT_127686 [Gelatoporia subvermispora B]